jgi:hypothetical protein
MHFIAEFMCSSSLNYVTTISTSEVGWELFSKLQREFPGLKIKNVQGTIPAHFKNEVSFEVPLEYVARCHRFTNANMVKVMVREADLNKFVVVEREVQEGKTFPGMQPHVFTKVRYNRRIDQEKLLAAWEAAGYKNYFV